MALKAGYIGIKKSMLGLINSLASAKLIKSFGDGLNLTSAGKLNMTAATASKIGGVKVGSGLEIVDGVLNTTAGVIQYSSTPVKTGRKWIDGRDIYAVVINNLNVAMTERTYGNICDISDVDPDADVPMPACSVFDNSFGNWRLGYLDIGKHTAGKIVYYPMNSGYCNILYMEYVKKAEEE